MVLSEIKLQHELEDRLQFETLLAEISARFVNLDADQVDSNIKDAQRRICQILDLDRTTLWQISEREPEALVLTHIHQPPEIMPPHERMNLIEFFPWATRRVLNGETITIHKLSDLPREAGRDLETFRAYGTKSNVCVPLSTGKGPVFGLLAFGVTREERSWSETVVKGFELIAQVFANTISRKQAEQDLRNSESRLRLSNDAAGVGLWILDPNTGYLWVTSKMRELFHFAPEEGLKYKSLLNRIHSEDRDRFKVAVQQAFQSGENLNCDYKIVLPGGDIRWMVTRGQLDPKSAGKPDRLMGVSADITDRKQMEEQLKEHIREIEDLKQRLETENICLREEIKLLVEHTDIVGQSVSMKRVLSQAEQVAQTDASVLLMGETGTGKELLARAIHRMSSRKDRPMVTVNCASLPHTLIESELFGRERGAYTGAMTKMIGRFEIANGSTLFLDEIGELPLDLQSKLLRVLEEGKIERLGSTKSINVNVRIIAATNRDIDQEAKVGKFRPDLLYRLNVFPIVIPPLRERAQDIPLLIRAAVKEFKQKMGKEIESIPKKTMEALQSYFWPGNVRELRNIIEHAMILNKGKILDVQVPKHASSETDTAGTLENMERRHIVAVLEKTGWRIAGPGGAAEVLGLKRTTLQAKMNKLGIKRSNKPMPQ